MHLTGWLVGFWAPLPLPTQRRHAVGAPSAWALHGLGHCCPGPPASPRLGLLGPLLPGQPCHLVATVRTAGQYPSGDQSLTVLSTTPATPQGWCPQGLGRTAQWLALGQVLPTCLHLAETLAVALTENLACG